VIEAPFALALTAGMVATVNPCGFAMLPAYLSYFLGTDEPDDLDGSASVLRAVAVGGVVTLGFLVVFGTVGLAVSHLSLSIYRYLPWVTLVIGIGLVVLGIAMLRGFVLEVRLPRLERGGTTRGLGSMLVFGISYAVASLSCTLPPFLAVMATTFSQLSYTAGVSVFLAYGLGMGLVLTVLTVAIAVTRVSLLTHLRRALPYIHRISGGLLVVAGTYLTWYGWYEVRVNRGDLSTPGPVAWVTDWSADLTTWLQNTGATRVAMMLGIVVCVTLLVALLWPRRDRVTPDGP
jgi:cytochrome c biogenesis protein CcdA